MRRRDQKGKQRRKDWFRRALKGPWCARLGGKVSAVIVFDSESQWVSQTAGHFVIPEKPQPVRDRTQNCNGVRWRCIHFLADLHPPINMHVWAWKVVLNAALTVIRFPSCRMKTKGVWMAESVSFYFTQDKINLFLWDMAVMHWMRMVANTQPGWLCRKQNVFGVVLENSHQTNGREN